MARKRTAGTLVNGPEQHSSGVCMTALDSMIGLLTLRAADALVLVAGERPQLLGAKEQALTMPVLDEATLSSFVEELLDETQRAAVAASQVVELERRSGKLNLCASDVNMLGRVSSRRASTT